MARSTYLVPLVVLLAVVGGALTLLLAAPDRSDPTPAPAALGQPADLAASAVAVLRGWDARRAHAYATGSVRELRRLYVAGSSAGVRDVRLLTRWTARGYRVAGMRTQLLDVRVVDRREDRLVLRVTDRLAAAVAVGEGRRIRLPRDTAADRVLTLLRDGSGDWQMATVS